MIWNKKQLDRIEKKLDTLNSWLARDITEIRFFLADLPPDTVSPAKAPKKRGKKPVEKPAKRKYVKSGKYKKVTT